MALSHITTAIDGLARTAASGHAFRHQAVEWGYSQPGAGARTIGGRWNPPNSFATLYLGLSVEAVQAEFHRLAERAGREASDFLPRHLLKYEIELEAILDLTDASALDALGLTTEHLRSNNPNICQEIGEAAHHLGREGILAPSATGSGKVMAVFMERLLPNSRIDLVSTTVWESPPD
ncbi:MAG TPA: RES family NAD+ phosphorylase [Solirubrobacterales bacterium]|nr:RES family NAD+ phosphorylase [Solirubrobacterales bacterium]